MVPEAMAVLALLAGQTAPAPAAPAAGTAMLPSSNWQADYVDMHCHVARGFGGTPPRALLVLQRDIQPANLDVTVKAPGLAGGPAEEAVAIELVNAATAEKIAATGILLGARGDRSVRIPRMPIGFIERLEGAPSLRVQVAGHEVAALKPLGVRKALAVLADCRRMMLAGWDVDAAAFDRLYSGPQPLGNPALWITSDDYPAQAIQNNERGDVAFRLTVGADGRASDCRLIEKTGSPALDEIVCPLLRERARFTPALDSARKPAAAPFVSRVYFRTWADMNR